ncbi:MAG: D-arabinose 5-phosphate isomerase [Gammaproteobacteria bacterium RIFCSPHIGHO2_12_FULL_41_20]|nr:MAG: D-arabinose 5-phosphate isomerase [Gammaproteobacteria bacterium RIFCSPHIGHO2_12_FULL_41_20]
MTQDIEELCDLHTATDIELFCKLGKAVVEIEAKTIYALTHRLDHRFAKACQYLIACSGRIVVMGVGKSGHIGRKIAATFASTGSPAFFVHPSEAKHGDIGMITKNDVALIFSYSGETEEIISILPFVKRLKIPVISLTGKPCSTLAKAATVNIDVSIEKEACPLGLAPTASTTAALVMGDALAMALLEHRGFTEQDFALSHPGGALGRRLLLQVNEIMHVGDKIPQVDHQASIKTALVEMTQKQLGMTTIVDGKNQLVGVFTDGDVRRAFDNHADIHKTPIYQVMSKNPKMIRADVLAAEALNIMETYKITSLVVTDEQNTIIGIVHIHDILRAGVA